MHETDVRIRAELGQLDHPIVDIENPPLIEYRYHLVLGRTLQQVIPMLEKDKAPKSSWKIWPNYVRGRADFMHTTVLYEFLLTNGKVTAIRKISKYYYKSIFVEDTWVDKAGNFHPEYGEGTWIDKDGYSHAELGDPVDQGEPICLN